MLEWEAGRVEAAGRVSERCRKMLSMAVTNYMVSPWVRPDTGRVLSRVVLKEKPFWFKTYRLETGLRLCMACFLLWLSVMRTSHLPDF